MENLKLVSGDFQVNSTSDKFDCSAFDKLHEKVRLKVTIMFVLIQLILLHPPNQDQAHKLVNQIVNLQMVHQAQILVAHLKRC